MAIVLIARPQGLLGRPQVAVRGGAAIEVPLRPASRALVVASILVLLVLLCLPFLARSQPYALVLGVDVLIAVLFATSLHFIMGPGGMISFGHAAYFGLGAYGAALAVKWLAAPMGMALALAPVAAAFGALLFGWFAVRLSGVYLAMLTLAFAQIVWSIVFQWQDSPVAPMACSASASAPFDRLVIFFSRWSVLFSAYCSATHFVAPFGYAMRAGRKSPLGLKPSASTSSACTGSASPSQEPFAASRRHLRFAKS